MKAISKLKEIKIPNWAAITIIVLVAIWAIFAVQRVLVLKEHGANMGRVFGSLTGIKYVAGLSYSAEEMEHFIKIRDAWQEFDSSVQKIRSKYTR